VNSGYKTSQQVGNQRAMEVAKATREVTYRMAWADGVDQLVDSQLPMPAALAKRFTINPINAATDDYILDVTEEFREKTVTWSLIAEREEKQREADLAKKNSRSKNILSRKLIKLAKKEKNSPYEKAKRRMSNRLKASRRSDEQNKTRCKKDPNSNDPKKYPRAPRSTSASNEYHGMLKSEARRTPPPVSSSKPIGIRYSTMKIGRGGGNDQLTQTTNKQFENQQSLSYDDACAALQVIEEKLTMESQTLTINGEIKQYEQITQINNVNSLVKSLSKLVNQV